MLRIFVFSLPLMFLVGCSSEPERGLNGKPICTGYSSLCTCEDFKDAAYQSLQNYENYEEKPMPDVYSLDLEMTYTAEDYNRPFKENLLNSWAKTILTSPVGCFSNEEISQAEQWKQQSSIYSDYWEDYW